MDTSTHTLNTLFAQLGLPDNDEAVAQFIREHRPLNRAVRVTEARFWSPAQKAFLAESLLEDSDWCEAVDELDALLHH